MMMVRLLIKRNGHYLNMETEEGEKKFVFSQARERERENILVR